MGRCVGGGMKGLEGASAGGCGTTRDVRKIERIQITGDVAWARRRGEGGEGPTVEVSDEVGSRRREQRSEKGGKREESGKKGKREREKERESEGRRG